ncbi:helix-turn-helix transcriptional regulator [Streptomyces sp. TRM49041]|uniref:helix-turn-helix transcriptional regulator n=1 Tax=Streptomyces sp. TRM49041 TaxID=2603216 RepID=UPI0011EED25B|nr:helix-turn-helix transcriptional regulator [Streptomyces sp. TRM49041]
MLHPTARLVLDRRRAFGNQIRAARLHANLTQQGISERTGIDRSVIISIGTATAPHHPTPSSSSPTRSVSPPADLVR